jgi:uncharacterized membrane protein
MKSFLQGEWLRHPLHAVLVHIPTALWPAAFLFDIMTRLGIGGNALVQTSFYAILFGLVVALLAIPTGIADWSGVKREKPAWKLGLYHLILNSIAFLLWAVNLGLRWETFTVAEVVPTGLVMLSLIGVVILSISGYLGGRMVVEYGISVARVSKKDWRRIAKAGGANLPPE